MEVLGEYRFHSQMLGREKNLLSLFYLCSNGGKQIQTYKHFQKYLNLIVMTSGLLLFPWSSVSWLWTPVGKRNR